MLRSASLGISRAIFYAGTCAIAIAVFLAIPGYAVDTRVDTTVCSGFSSNASLAINSPANGGVVENSTVTVSGTISNLTQISVTIDGQYNSTVPISANQTSFTTSLQLAEGTRTISFEGNDICAFNNPVASLILTYQPKMTPATVTQPVATVTPGTSTASPSTSGNDVGTSDNFLSKIPVVGALAPFLTGLSKSLDFDVAISQSGIWIVMARFALFVAGINLLFFGKAIAMFIHRAILGHQATQESVKQRILTDPNMGKRMRHSIAFARIAGIIFLAGAFVI